jgi:hypothetical protein
MPQHGVVLDNPVDIGPISGDRKLSKNKVALCLLTAPRKAMPGTPRELPRECSLQPAKDMLIGWRTNRQHPFRIR